MSVVNCCEIIGRIAKDITVTQNGDVTAARTSVAVQRNFKDKDGNYGADFIPVFAFGKTAEFLNEHFGKGDAIAIRGNIRTGSYTNKDGNKVYTTEVAIDEISFVPGAKKSDEVTEEVPEETPKKTTKKSSKKEVPEDGDFMNISEGDLEELPW